LWNIRQFETVFRIDIEVAFRWKDTSTRHSKTCYQSHSSTIANQICKRSQNFSLMVFQMIPPVRVKTCAWNILLAGEFMILIPSICCGNFVPKTQFQRNLN